MKHLKTTIILSLTILLSACQTIPPSYGDPRAKTPARGAAGGATAINAPDFMERCDKPVGTVSISKDDESAYYKHAARYGLNSTAQSLRLFAQQSNCFVIVERGDGLISGAVERELEDSGELREGSNFSKGQLAAADYTIEPSLIFQDQNAGGTRGGLIGVFGTVLAGAAGKVQHKEAQAMLLMIDNRSGIQVSISEGSARGTDKELFIGALGVPLAGGFIDSYARTHNDKIIVGSYLDAFNNLVKAVRNYVPQESALGNGHGRGGSLHVN